jgi:hypothetical protein
VGLRGGSEEKIPQPLPGIEPQSSSKLIHFLILEGVYIPVYLLHLHPTPVPLSSVSVLILLHDIRAMTGLDNLVSLLVLEGLWERSSDENMGLRVFMAMKTRVMVFWVVMPYSDVVGYQRFRGPYCIFFTLKMEAAWLSEALVSWHMIKRS